MAVGQGQGTCAVRSPHARLGRLACHRTAWPGTAGDGVRDAGALSPRAGQDDATVRRGAGRRGYQVCPHRAARPRPLLRWRRRLPAQPGRRGHGGRRSTVENSLAPSQAARAATHRSEGPAAWRRAALGAREARPHRSDAAPWRAPWCPPKVAPTLPPGAAILALTLLTITVQALGRRRSARRSRRTFTSDARGGRGWCSRWRVPPMAPSPAPTALRNGSPGPRRARTRSRLTSAALDSAQARPLRLLGWRLTAPGGAPLPGREAGPLGASPRP